MGLSLDLVTRRACVHHDLTVQWSVGQRYAVGVAAGAVVLAPFAVVADIGSGMSTRAVAVDVTIGLLLAVSGLLGRPYRQGALVSLVGAAWLLGSVATPFATSSRGTLLLVVLAFPTGLVRNRWGWWPYPAAALAALPGCPQAVVALIFAATSITLAVSSARQVGSQISAAVAACVAATQAVGPVALGGGVAELVGLSSVGYRGVLVAVAVGFPWASRTVARSLIDSVMRGRPESGAGGDPLAHLAEILGRALGDRSLKVSAVSAVTSVTSAPMGVAHAAAAGQLVVEDFGVPVAVVRCGTAVLEDPATAGAVSQAVRLVVRNSAMVENERRRVAEVIASRGRLVEAEDRERAALGALLRTAVTEPLELLIADLGPVSGRLADPAARSAVQLVVEELSAAVMETESMLNGLPPGELGEGRLASALEEVARGSPVPMSVTMTPDAVGDVAAETALYAVCAEALTNVLKHAGATRVECQVTRDGDHLVARVHDNGVGGADVTGSGLQGLIDRLSAHGGRLQVHSEPGAGTILEARVPARAQPILS